MHDLLVERTPISDRVWDMSKILDWAFLHLPVDEKKIAITGNSGGGTITFFAVACDRRITVAVKILWAYSMVSVAMVNGCMGMLKR
jgi:cephalosporin-C deacetylase-like acetyl esterase